MSFLRNITIKLKIFLLVAVFAVGFLIYGGIAYFTLNSYKINSTTYHKIEREMNFASDMEPPHLWLQQAYFVTSRIQNEPDQEHAREMVEDLKKTKVNYEESFAKWKKDLAEGEVKDLIVNKIDKPARDFFETVEKEFIPAVLSGDAKKIASLNVTVLEKDYKEQTKYIEQAIELNRAQNGQDESEVASATNFWSAFLVIIAFVITGLVCFLGWFITRIISEPLNQVVDKITAISEGDTNQTFDYQSNDEIGKLASVFRSLNSYIREVAGSVEALGNGNLNAKITVRSEKDLLSRNVTRSIESLQQIMTETNQLIQAAQEGNLSLRGDTTKYQGAYSQLVGGINKMMDTVAMPITEAVDVLEKISNRDLTVHMNGDYKGDFAKIKNSLNQATDNLDEGFKQIAVSSEQVASAATQISAGSQNLAQSASEQASTLEEVSSNIQEISSMSRQNESNSKEARSLSDDARNITRRGMKSMQKLSEAVERIKTSSDSTAKIVKTIEEIAFQTNLLALNAAVEAARAGDAGKGFAVVAEEVRNLAMRSAEAAKTTAQLIDEAVTNTNEGVSLNTEVLQNFEEINGQIEKVSIVISEIAAASEQQNQGVAQINSAVEQMNGVTQQAAANSEESASAAEELSSQSQEMLGLIESYKLSGNSTTGKTFGRQQSHHAFQKAVVNLKTSSALTHHPLSKPLKSKKNGNSLSSMVEPENFIPFDDMSDAVLKDF